MGPYSSDALLHQTQPDLGASVGSAILQEDDSCLFVATRLVRTVQVASVASLNLTLPCLVIRSSTLYQKPDVFTLAQLPLKCNESVSYVLVDTAVLSQGVRCTLNKKAVVRSPVCLSGQMGCRQSKQLNGMKSPLGCLHFRPTWKRCNFSWFAL